ncbi:hypothetical protein BUALT_Bualt12G0056300 [Buddleja alternifolia]|uniref:F-box domain-containing protein n=1 Tax=Buddleja alternifolia TaxID=168488 RepID=A0AAV6WNP1_9LAMI|nr:hypothetical protein BUALT_Bualt12G0056300 [Buddleja alternifolia]
MMNCKRSVAPNSAAIIGGNDDLLLQILIFFPAKSLVRFKLVSKHWHSLISDSSFSELHTLRHRHGPKPQPSFLLRSTTSQFFHFDPTVKKLTTFRFKFPFVNILQSCNGLILLEGKNTQYGRKNYYIYNPATMQSRKLLIDDAEKKTFSGLCLVFNPSKSYHYQVICFRKDKNINWPELGEWFEVYDSETHTWIYGRKTTYTRPNTYCNGVYCNGDIFYIRLRPRPLCFVPNDDFYSVSKIPRIRSPGEKRTCVMESNGYLHYMVQSLHMDKKYICVYEMNEDYYSWFVKYRVDLNPVSATFGNNGKAITVLGIIRGEKEEDTTLLFHVPGKIMLYRFFNEIFEVLVDFTREIYYQGGILQFGSKDSYQFVETLVPV